MTIKKRYGAYAFLIACLSMLSLIAFQNCAKSDYGNQDTASVIAAASVPENVSLKINSGKLYTKDANVQLSLGAINSKEVLISNSPTCDNASDLWEPYTTVKNWTLPELNKEVSVYVQYKSPTGMKSPCLKASIFHDNIPPMVTLASMPAKASPTTKSDFLFNNSETGSGIEKVLCRFDAGADADCVPGTMLSQVLTDGDHNFNLTVTDKAGNASVLTYDWKIASVASTAFQVLGITSIDNLDANADAFLARSATPRVQWQASVGAVSYLVSVLNAANAVVCPEVNVGNVTSYNFAAAACNLADAGSFSAKVVALNAANVQQLANFAFRADRSGPTYTLGNVTANSAARTANVNIAVADAIAGVNTVTCILSLNNTVIRNDNCLNATNRAYTNLASGSYRFQLSATDKVGNASTSIVRTFNIGTFVCDPFSPANGTNCANALKGRLVYYTGERLSVFDALAAGVDTGADFRLSHLFSPYNQSIPGIRNSDGTFLQKVGGGTIVDFFAWEVSGNFKLAAGDVAGLYDWAVIADDGIIVNLNGAEYLNNDGPHALGMICNENAPIQMDANSRVAINVKYYQDAFEAGFNLVYRKRGATGTFRAEPNCAHFGSDWYGMYAPIDQNITSADLCAIPGNHYNEICSRGWKATTSDNFTQ